MSNSTSSSTNRATEALVPWRARRDLVAQSVAVEGEVGWTLKDPLSLAYFRLRDVEFALFNLLDGRVTYAQLLELVRQKFPAERWTLENVRPFLASLIQSGLVTSLLPGQGMRHAQQRQMAHSRRRWSWFTGLLAIRWKGIDPEPWLRRIEPWTRWLFRPAVIAACCALIGFALLLVTIRSESLLQRLPDAESLFGLSHLLPLLVVFVCIKLLHELGHVLTCRHFGGECHELGIQVLLFVPLFYGDVTDAWMQARRWPRIAISGAGIFVELVLAAMATLLWWNSVPGLLNSIFLNVMIVCSVNTLLFNGNPLLRYDGYYMLADLLDIPNLGQQARQVAYSVWERLLLGVTDEDLEPNARRWWLLAVYGFASAIYRWLILVSIVWFLHSIFATSGLSFVATALSAVMIVGAIVTPLREFVQRARLRWSQQTLAAGRAGRGFACLAVLLALLLFVPLPYSVSAPFVTYSSDAQPVFVTAAGQLESALAVGTKVQAGDVLAELTNHELQLQLEQQRSQVGKLTIRLKHLEAQRSRNATVAARIPATRDELAVAQRRLKQLQSETKRLRIVSPTSGTVLPPPNVPRERLSDDSLPDWSGVPQEALNLGATLNEQTLLCFIGDPRQHDALLLIPQDAVEFLKVGQSVRLQFASHPGRVRTGQVEEIAATRAESVPRELDIARLVATRQSSQGLVPAEVSYEIRVRLTDHGNAALFSPGQARVACAMQSLGSRFWRLLRHTFSADLGGTVR